jgi:hypothetical protein
MTLRSAVIMYTNALLSLARASGDDWFSLPLDLYLSFLPTTVEEPQPEEGAIAGVSIPTLDTLTRMAVHAELLVPRDDRPGHVLLLITETLRDLKLYISSIGGSSEIFKAARNDKRLNYLWHSGTTAIGSSPRAPVINTAGSGQSIDSIRNQAEGTSHALRSTRDVPADASARDERR